VYELCRKLGVSRSGYYAWLNRRESSRARENRKLVGEIRVIHSASRETYGSPRVHATLRRQGYGVNRKRVARLMRVHGIVSKMRVRFKPRRHDGQRYNSVPNLLLDRSFPTEKNQVWVGDVTYVRIKGRWTYLAVVMDLHTRKVIGWSYSKYRLMSMATEALLMAVLTESPQGKLIFHSDQGTEYASNGFKAALAEHGIIQSMSRKGCCWDNAFMESFFHTLKTEMLYFQKLNNFIQATAYILDYIHFYNHERIHSSLEYKTPDQYDRLAA